MTQLQHHLVTDGIALIDDVYDAEQREVLDAALNPHFAARASEPRAYAFPVDMIEFGIMDHVLTPRLIDLLFAIMADPVLYHFHFYEIAASRDQSHIFADQLGGWHRDPDSLFEANEATHVSLFVYLTDVGADNGAFQFIPNLGVGGLTRKHRGASLQGPAGTSFLWHRSFYHRASPNASPVRRRLLKISIQNNRFPSVHLQNDTFAPAAQAMRERSPRHEILFGAYQGQAQVPHVERPPALSFRPVTADLPLEVPHLELLKKQLRGQAKKILPTRSRPNPATVPYD